MLILNYHHFIEDGYEAFYGSEQKSSDVFQNLPLMQRHAVMNADEACFVDTIGQNRWRLIPLKSAIRVVVDEDVLIFENKEKLKEYLFDIVFNGKPL